MVSILCNVSKFPNQWFYDLEIGGCLTADGR